MHIKLPVHAENHERLSRYTVDGLQISSWEETRTSLVLELEMTQAC